MTLHTVNRHNEHIFKKLGVDNRQKAIKAVQERLVAALGLPTDDLFDATAHIAQARASASSGHTPA